MKKNDMDMWKDLNFVPAGDANFEVSARTIGGALLFKGLLNKTSGHLAEFSDEGTLKQTAESENEKPMTVAEKLSKFFAEKEGRLYYKYVMDDGENSIYLWKDGIAELNVSGTWANIRMMSYDEKLVREVKSYFDGQWQPAEKRGHIYAIVRNGMHLSLNSIGNAGIPLVSDNYTPKVQEDYKYAIKDLRSETPSGRIVIMKGTPGTGKTHLVRAMLLEVPDAMFVLISPDVVKNLAGPELLPLLMNYRGNTTGPIVLILEDADKCLVSRETDKEDISSIQAILNLGDGILGSLLDLRIVATTNASEFKMDPAILRPGRLSKMLDVTALDFNSARAVFMRLLPDAKELPEVLQKENPHNRLQITLAEVYALARQNGWASAVRKVEEEEDDEDEDWDD
jgi:hypothetical protein